MLSMQRKNNSVAYDACHMGAIMPYEILRLRHVLTYLNKH